MKKRKTVAILLALLVVRVAVMFASPIFDKSESRYATLAVNMARTGDFLVPHFIHDGVYQSFNGKPPLVFQLVERLHEKPQPGDILIDEIER